ASDYEMITETFNTYGLDPLMGLSLVNIESDFNHGALNHTDEEGEVISEWQFTFGTTYALGRDWSRMIEPAYATETAALLHQAVESGNAALGLVGIEKIQEELEPSSPHKLTPSIRAALHAIAHHSTGLQERVLRNYYATGLLTVPEGNPKTENHLQNFMASYAQITGSIEKGDLGKQIRDLRRDNSRLREARPEEGDVDFSQLNEVPKNLSIPDMPDQIAEELKASTLWTEDSREGLIVYFEPISEAFESNSLDPVMGLTLAKTLSEFDSAEVGDAGKWGERRSIWQFTQAEVVAMGADWNQMTDPTYALNFAVQYHRALDYGSTGYENEGLVNIMVDARSDAEQRGTTLYEPTHGTYVALHLLARQSGVHAAERAFREYLNDGTLNLATPIRGDDRGWLEHIVITGVPAYLELNEAVHRLTDTGKN
ncbi:MAG: hypothetical protein KDD42_03130, partial [Bdellovibrionales bacterium]|nr:hypothetical protein [Bdellovibrionales bacterium]